MPAPVLFVVETTAVLVATTTPVVLSIEPALGLGAAARLLRYPIRVWSWSVRRTVGVAAATWSPFVSEDEIGTDPQLRADTFGVAVAVATFVRAPPAPVLFVTGVNGVFSIVPTPNLAGDTVRVRAWCELLQ